jgi:hypothetical protein
MELFILLWWLTSVLVVSYGVSNHAVTAMALPRWSSLAVGAVGVVIMMSLIAIMSTGVMSSNG